MGTLRTRTYASTGGIINASRPPVIHLGRSLARSHIQLLIVRVYQRFSRRYARFPLYCHTARLSQTLDFLALLQQSPNSIHCPVRFTKKNRDDLSKFNGTSYSRPRSDKQSTETLDRGSKSILSRVWQPPKQHFAIVSTDEGIQIDRSDEQFENADSPRTERWQLESKVTVDRLVQSWKHTLQIVSIDEGI
jgi:hypothetical protein